MQARLAVCRDELLGGKESRYRRSGIDGVVSKEWQELSRGAETGLGRTQEDGSGTGLFHGVGTYCNRHGTCGRDQAKGWTTLGWAGDHFCMHVCAKENCLR